MQVQSQQELEAPKRGEYVVESSHWLSDGFNFMKENMGVMIGFSLMFFAIAIGAQIIPIIGPLISSFVISPALLMGFYLYAYRKDRGENPEFSAFFDGFQYLGKLVPIALLQMVLLFVLMIPAAVIFGVSFATMAEGGFSPLLLVAVLLIIVPAIYLGISWMYAYPLAVFFDLSAWDAMETSRKIITNHFWAWLGFALLLGLVAMGGALALFIGLLFAYPTIMYAQYVGFREITNLVAEGGEDDILEHLVE